MANGFSFTPNHECGRAGHAQCQFMTYDVTFNGTLRGEVTHYKIQGYWKATNLKWVDDPRNFATRQTAALSLINAI